MTPSRYLVIQRGSAWTITSGNRTFGPLSDHVCAIDAAIDFAEKDGKAGRPAEVLVQADGRALRTVWTFGRDPYPSTPGNPANRRAIGTYRCHDDPFSDTATCQSPGVAIAGRRNASTRVDFADAMKLTPAVYVNSRPPDVSGYEAADHLTHAQLVCQRIQASEFRMLRIRYRHFPGIDRKEYI